MSTRRGLPDTTQSASAAHSIVGDLRAHSERPGRGRDAPRPVKLTVQIAAEVVEELRDAVVYLPGQGVRATVAAVTERALRRELDRLRDEHHDGQPFPTRSQDPPVGRPIA